jgi:diguanylate cyclase (GGDEF)-like protein
MLLRKVIWSPMKKDDLKSLVTQVYRDILQRIEEQENPTKEQLVDELHNASQTIESMSEEQIDSLEQAKAMLATSYKELAQHSISSYAHTNSSFEKITKEHQETLQQHKDELIDYPSIKEKFDDLQNTMEAEVNKANALITKLSQEVKELDKKSNLDPLTKIFNRRAMDTYLEKICARKNLNHELHLLLLDIDDFKKINDLYGHVAGDKLLIYLANLLQKTLRDGDKLFRYGGEEFVIILNRIEEDACMDITHRILEAVRSNRLIYKGKSLCVTMSIGATKYHNGDTPTTLIERADRALYKSKSLGKNQMNVEIKSGV